MLPIWSILYSSSLAVSSVAAAVISSSIYRHTELRNSAVRLVFFFFFFYLWLWSLFRGVFYLSRVLLDDDGASDDTASAGTDYEYTDALGLHGVANITSLTQPWLSFILIMGDTALMASSLWMFPMTWELSRLARRSMDRGVAGERDSVQWYLKWVHVLIIIFFVAEAGFTIYNRGFNSRSYRILIGGNMIQALTLVYVVYALAKLKWSGRKYEAIHGTTVASPLYSRLKSIMIVYGLFSFQYQIISMILLFSHFEIEIPTLLIGVSTLLFNNSGTALSVIMGCSQECMFRYFRRHLPEEYTLAFYVAEPTAALASAAVVPNPPMVNPVFVFTDIEASSQLWALENGRIMHRANELHDEILRRYLAKHRGYEVSTCGDAFQLVFHTILNAMEYCVEVQHRLLSAEWPKELHDALPATKRERGKSKQYYFSGLRVRMGIHDAQEVDGVLVTGTHPMTGKVTYTGLSQVVASEIGDVGAGGEICVTRRVARWLQRNSASLSFRCEVERVGAHRIEPLDLDLDVYRVTPVVLARRKPTFDYHWSSRHDGDALALEKSQMESSQVWSSISIDAIESAYSASS